MAMPEIHYKTLDTYLNDLKQGTVTKDESNKVGPAPVYLIYGEEYFYKIAYEKLIDTLIPVASRSLNLETIEGPNENIHEAIERVSTFSLLSGAKVVAIRDSSIFDSKLDKDRFFDKIRQAHQINDFNKASKYLLSLMGILNLSYSDVSEENRSKALKLDPDDTRDDKWLAEIIDHCLENNLGIPAAENNERLLQSAIESGFPPQNYLVITTYTVDKRRGLYKSINNFGLIIDCSVPKGNRRSDKMAREKVLSAELAVILAQSQKTMEKDAYPVLYEMTGFDLRTFFNNLGKLISYVGERQRITRKDVEFVIERTKKDPIYAFTNAISDKDIEMALFYLESLISEGLKPIRPEQIIVALANQMRKLIVIKGFVASPSGKRWHAGCSFADFKRNVLPAVQEYDQTLLRHLMDWQKGIANDTDNESGKLIERKDKKSRSVTDLVAVKSAGNPYPVYQLLKKSERFTEDQLFSAFESLNRADLRIKTSGENKKLILEEAIFDICR
jgi:DNA polymerase-3 subunit delta